MTSLSATYFGSSPHVRGTLSDADHDRIRGRFIPACAGNTPTGPNTATVPSVHPRMCGEHTKRKALILNVVYTARFSTAIGLPGKAPNKTEIFNC